MQSDAVILNEEIFQIRDNVADNGSQRRNGRCILPKPKLVFMKYSRLF